MVREMCKFASVGLHYGLQTNLPPYAEATAGGAMKTRVSIALTMCLLMVAVYVSGQGQAPQPSQLTTQKLADDLFVIRNPFVPGNTTVLVTNEGVVLVDDKFEVDVNNILAQVKTVTNQPIRYVVTKSFPRSRNAYDAGQSRHFYGDMDGRAELIVWGEPS